MNLIRLKQTAQRNTLQEEHNEKTAEAIKSAEKNFSVDLPLLVDEIYDEIYANRHAASGTCVNQ